MSEKNNTTSAGEALADVKNLQKQLADQAAKNEKAIKAKDVVIEKLTAKEKLAYDQFNSLKKELEVASTSVNSDLDAARREIADLTGKLAAATNKTKAVKGTVYEVDGKKYETTVKEFRFQGQKIQANDISEEVVVALVEGESFILKSI